MNKIDTNSLIKSIPSHIEALIFDLDGTLADTMPTHIEAWITMGNTFGASITAEMINTYAGSPTPTVIETLNKQYDWSIPIEEGTKMKSALYAQLLEAMTELKSIEKVMEIATHYHGKLPLGIGTGSGRSNANRTINALGVGEMFGAIVTASDVINPKPHHETFTKCADLLGIPYKSCLVFEDGPMGMIAAISGGMSVMTVPYYTIITSLDEVENYK